ncbi:MAG: ABC transporter permease subunit [Caldilineaceae bacterium]|nr:ABC transporter permease subunit [Caldilineaceae bacterium]
MREDVTTGAALVPEMPDPRSRLHDWRGRLERDIRNNWQLYVMILPVLVGFFLFRFYPLYGLQIAFKDYNIVAGVRGSEWVGLENFLKFFEDPFFFRVVKNTVVLGFWTLVISYPLPIVFAVLLNEVKQQHGLFKRVTQSISYLPHFVAVVVIVGLMYDFFSSDGIVNQMAVALTGEKWRILGSSAWFRPLYVGSVVWQGVGWGSIIYLAALTGIPPELYEAAIVDGASRWQRILYVTLPGLLPVISVTLILSVSSIVSVGFERAFLLQQPATYSVSDVIATYVYRRGLIKFDFSYGAAIGFFDSIVAFALVVGANYIVKRTNEDREGLW